MVTDNTPQIFVEFFGVQNGEELYCSTLNNKILIRQPSNINDSWYSGKKDGKVFWLSSSKWRGGYEASCPLKDGLKVNIVGGRHGEIIFSETLHADEPCGGTSAEQKAPFAWEIKKHVAKEFAEEYNLSDYDSWKAMLCQEKIRCKYEGYIDNWLFCEADTMEKKNLKSVTEYGMTFRIIEEHRKHRISGTEWTEYYLVSKLDDVVEEICGYKF